MYRKAFEDLVIWKNRRNRKPLVLRGARQVGKTHLVRKFGKKYFENLIEINFDKAPDKAGLFGSGDIEKSLQFLEIDARTQIVPGKTLLFFDEIQAAPSMLPLLRYLYEERPDLHVIAAGSLLEFLLTEHDFSMPVGRVEYMYLGPMNIEEFLLATDQDKLQQLLCNFSFPDSIPAPIHENLLYYLKLFLIIGGMPAAVKQYAETGDIQESVREQTIILQTYEDDFTKYRKRIYPQRLKKVFRRIPALVGGKLKYVHIDPDERSRELADTLDLLELAQVIYRVKHSSGNGVPLGAEVKDKDFKPLFLDTGLMSSALGLTLPTIELASHVLFVNKGAVAEQFIGQHLLYDRPGYERPRLYYWNREKRNSSAEIDYLITLDDQVVPVEVKAGTTGSLKSLQIFITEKKTKVALRFNAMQPSCNIQKTGVPGHEPRSYVLLSLPLYLVGQSRRLLNEAYHAENNSTGLCSL